MTLNQLHTLDDAATALGIAKSTLRFHISGGAVRATKIGGRVFISSTEISRVQRDGIPTTIASYKKASKTASEIESPSQVG